MNPITKYLFLPLLTAVCLQNIGSVELPVFVQDLANSSAFGERIVNNFRQQEEYRQQWLKDRYRTAVFLYESGDSAALSSELSLPVEYRDTRSAAELEDLLYSDLPRPQTEAYRQRFSALREYQIYSGVPAAIIDEFIETTRAITTKDFSSGQIQEYFAKVERLTVDAPRADDVRTWRFLFSQDFSQRVLLTLSMSGDGFISGLRLMADEVRVLDSEISNNMMTIALHLERLATRHRSILSWLGQILDESVFVLTEMDEGDENQDPKPIANFAPNELPVYPVELSNGLLQDPLLAAGLSFLMTLLPKDGFEEIFIQSIVRMSLTASGKGGVSWSGFYEPILLKSDSPVYYPISEDINSDLNDDAAQDESSRELTLAPVINTAEDSFRAQLLDDIWISEYLRRNRASRNSLQTFERQQNRAWYSDIHQKTEVFSSRIMQEELAETDTQRIHEVMRDTQREWLDGLRIPGSRRIEYLNAGFPETILIVDKHIDPDRIRRARDIWIRETGNGADSLSYALNPEQWFAAHGLIILAVDREHPVWHADLGGAVEEASRLLCEMLDTIQNSSDYPQAFLQILTVDFAIRIAGLQHSWITHGLHQKIENNELNHPDDFVRFEILRMYAESLESVVEDISGRIDSLPDILEGIFDFTDLSHIAQNGLMDNSWFLSYLSIKTMLEHTYDTNS